MGTIITNDCIISACVGFQFFLPFWDEPSLALFVLLELAAE
jgi:hypothetical protein